ncbi:MAG: M23 family metallopeptidase [Thermodesulfobacteriota bacterium]|nr:M23 family metallopeptidase [Thermodesulfobacteriota bacterium]
MKTIKSFFILLLLVAIGGGGYFYFHDRQGPLAHLSPNRGSINKTTPIILTLNDDASALANVSVSVLQNGKQVKLLNKSYSQNVHNATEHLDLSELLLRDGMLTIQVTSLDRAIYNFGKGNSSTTTINLLRDTRAPVIAPLSTAHNLNVGGAGLIVYTTNEAVAKSGIKIGDHFFPGHQQISGEFLCLFAFPYDTDPDTIPRLVATDEAGNHGAGGFYYHLNQRKFRVDTINISDRFLTTKMPQFQNQFPEAKTPLELFMSVNGTMRPQNRAWLGEVATKTGDMFEWSQSFLRQPNAATRATFGDLRHYMYNGKEIDQQTHLGIDLASTARAAVPATNNGTVVYADFMGIYGQCIIVDHGLGLQTLYAHLSSMNASVGEMVERGQTIGHTGATGLAGGDHLHYGVIISGVPVNPIEWWDKNWIRNNITSKLGLRAGE